MSDVTDAPTPPYDAVKMHRFASVCMTFLHAVLALVMLSWAVILWLPVDTFPTSRSYLWFVEHWPHTEHGWSIAFLVAALCGAPGLLPHAGITLRGRHFRTQYLRMASAGVLGMAHADIAWATAWSNIGSTGTVPYLLFATIAVFRIVGEGQL